MLPSATEQSEQSAEKVLKEAEMVKNDPQEIHNFLEKYFSSYEKFDFDTCKSLWDAKHTKLTYKATETASLMTEFSQIVAYMDANHAITLHAFRPSKVITIDFIRDDVVFVFANMICKFDIPQTEPLQAAYQSGQLPIAPGSKVDWKGTASFVIHRDQADGEWKLIHYEDATAYDLKNSVLSA